MIEIAGGVILTVRLNPELATWGVGEQLSVAEIDNVAVPEPVGVPDSRPEDDNVRPAGMPVPPQVMPPVPPVLVNWKL